MLYLHNFSFIFTSTRITSWFYLSVSWILLYNDIALFNFEPLYFPIKSKVVYITFLIFRSFNQVQTTHITSSIIATTVKLRYSNVVRPWKYISLYHDYCCGEEIIKSHFLLWLFSGAWVSHSFFYLDLDHCLEGVHFFQYKESQQDFTLSDQASGNLWPGRARRVQGRNPLLDTWKCN